MKSQSVESTTPKISNAKLQEVQIAKLNQIINDGITAIISGLVDVSGSSNVGVVGPLTDTELRATPVPISGTVSATVDTSLLATELTLDKLTIAQGDSVEDQVGPLIQGLVNDTPNSYQSGIIQPLSLTTEGRLRVSNVDSYIDQIWQHTFENPWNEMNIPETNQIDYPSVGAI